MGRKVNSQIRKQLEELDGKIAGEAVNPRYRRRMVKALQTLLDESGQELEESEISRYQRTVDRASDELDALVDADQAESSSSSGP